MANTGPHVGPIKLAIRVVDIKVNQMKLLHEDLTYFVIAYIEISDLQFKCKREGWLQTMALQRALYYKMH